MDTNLLDNCREARGEMEHNVVPEMVSSLNDVVTSVANDSCGMNLFCSSTKSQSSHISNPRTLRRWLRETENRIAQMPTLSQALKMRSSEIQKKLTDHLVSF